MAGKRPQRQRRVASGSRLRLLRLAGWRYSISRDAWVHRTFRGRVGPVFIDDLEPAVPGPEPEPVIFLDGLPSLEPVPLGDDDRWEQLIESIDAALRPDHRVRIRLTEHDEERAVLVDGRPPRRDGQRSDWSADGPVLPMRPTRAAG